MREWFNSRLELFKKSMYNAFKAKHAQSISIDDLNTQLEQDNPIDKFPEAEVTAMLAQMQDENKIMTSENMIFLI